MSSDAIDHTTEAERRLVRKLDTRLLPLVTAYYFVAYVNRVNVANLHTELTEALGLTEEQFSWVVSIFFTSFIVFEVPSNLCLKRLSPRKWLAFLGLAWGVSSMALAWSSSYASILIARVFLGIFQAGVFPGILYYLTLWYKRDERGLRFSIFCSASFMAVAMSGLFAYGLLKMDGLLALKGWQWTFLIEGAPSLVLGAICWFVLPNSPATCYFLTPSERLLGQSRLMSASESVLIDSSDAEAAGSQDTFPIDDDPTSPLLASQSTLDALDAKFSSSSALSTRNETWCALTNLDIWLFCFTNLLLLGPNAALQFFLPKIVELLGFDPLTSNLITAPVFFIAAGVSLYVSRQSDKRQERVFFLMLCCAVGVVGFLGLAGFTPGNGFFIPRGPSCVTDSDGNTLIQALIPLTFATFAVASVSSTVPLKCAWFSASIPRHRSTMLAVGTAMLVSVGSFGAIIAPQLYAFLGTANQIVDEPQCTPSEGNSTVLMMLQSGNGTMAKPTVAKPVLDYTYAHLFMAGSLTLAIGMSWFLRWRIERRRRALERAECQSLCWAQPIE